MKKSGKILLMLLAITLAFNCSSWAGNKTTHGYFYKPAYLEKGAVAYALYNAALDATDTVLYALVTGLSAINTLVTNWAPMENQDILIATSGQATYMSAIQFVLNGDQTEICAVNKKVRFDLGAGVVKGSYITESIYAGGVTTININDAILTDSIAGVWITATRNGLFPYGPGYVVARDYGSPGQAAIDGALAAIGILNRTLVLSPGTWSITADTAIPANVTLSFQSGAVLAVATTKTLTINGPVQAMPYQIFSWAGTGKVVFGYPLTVYPEWWGAVGDAATDDRAAIQAALTSLTNGSGGSLVFSGKSYAVNSFGYDVTTDDCSGMTFHSMLGVGSASGDYKTIKIIGKDGAVLTTPLLVVAEAQVASLLTLTGKLQDVEITGLTFIHTHGVTTTATTAINVVATDYQVRYPQITACRFKNFSNAIHIPGCDAPVIERCTFTSDLGRDSGGGSSTMPNVGIRSERSTRNIKVVTNTFNGCVINDLSAQTQKTQLDGFYMGWAKGSNISNNTITRFAYEAIYVLPASAGTTTDPGPYGAIVKGNFIDANPVTGAVALPGATAMYYSIRCDDSNSQVVDNTLVNTFQGIFVKWSSASPFYPDDIYNIRIADNLINMMGGAYITQWGIFVSADNSGGYDHVHHCEIIDNQIYWQSVMISELISVNGIVVTSGSNHRVIGNKVINTTPLNSYELLTGSPTYVSSSQFTLTGDYTTRIGLESALKVVLAGGTYYMTAEYVSYAAGTGLTTVVVHDAILTNPITSVSAPLRFNGITTGNTDKVYLDRNETNGCGTGIYANGTLIDMDTHTFANCGQQINGSAIGGNQLLWRQQRMSFTPTATATGYYRVLWRQASLMAGTLKVRSDEWDNAVTNLVLSFDYGGYSAGGAINQIGYGYLGGHINKVRCCSIAVGAGGSTQYLDLSLSTATAPGAIEVILENNNQRGMVLMDPPLYSPTLVADAVELTCGTGFVTTVP